MANRAYRTARAVAIAYAACVALNGVAWSVIGILFLMIATQFDPRGGLLLMLVPGVLFQGLSVFIWGGAVWAMIAACVLALLHWASLLGPQPWNLLRYVRSFSDLTNVPHLAVAVLFGMLTLGFVVVARKANAT
jgi:hypothetical protein